MHWLTHVCFSQRLLVMRVILLLLHLHWLIWVMSLPCKWINPSLVCILLVHVSKCLRIILLCIILTLSRHVEGFLVWKLGHVVNNLVICSHRVVSIAYLCKLSLGIVLFSSMSSCLQLCFSLSSFCFLPSLHFLFGSHFYNSCIHLGWCHSLLISGACYSRMEVWLITCSNYLRM